MADQPTPDPLAEEDAVRAWDPSDEAGRRQIVDLLTNGDLEIVGRLVDASNLNLYCT